MNCVIQDNWAWANTKCNYPSLKQHKHYYWFLGWNRWCWMLEHTSLYKLLEIYHYIFWAEIFTEFFRHLEKNYEKINKGFGLKEKIRKIKQVDRKISVQEKKSERGVCLLFWLKNCSIIGVCFIPILVLKFQLKIIVKTSDKTRGFLSFFFKFFLLYSRAILSFSLSPSLLLCPFHCFNYWITI